MKSCYEIHKGKIYLYHNADEQTMVDNIWWQKLKSFVNFIKITVPCYINNTGIFFPHHKADIMRLYILQKFGGVYMDTDIYSLSTLNGDTVKPLFNTELTTNRELSDNLYDHSLVICQECEDKLCNCMIMVEPNHKLIKEWIDCYNTTYGKDKDYWGGLSVMTPYKLIKSNLIKENKENVSVLKQNNFLPFLYRDASFFYEDKSDKLGDSMVMHLWDTEMSKMDLIPENLDYFEKNANSTITKLFKKYC